MGVWAERVQRLARVEVQTAGEARRDDDQREQDPAEDLRRDLPVRPRRRRRLPVAAHGLEHGGRENRAAVAVEGRSATQASLRRRPHSAETPPYLSDLRILLARFGRLLAEPLRDGEQASA